MHCLGVAGLRHHAGGLALLESLRLLASALLLELRLSAAEEEPV